MSSFGLTVNDYYGHVFSKKRKHNTHRVGLLYGDIRYISNGRNFYVVVRLNNFFHCNISDNIKHDSSRRHLFCQEYISSYSYVVIIISFCSVVGLEHINLAIVLSKHSLSSTSNKVNEAFKIFLHILTDGHSNFSHYGNSISVLLYFRGFLSNRGISFHSISNFHNCTIVSYSFVASR